jgi:beta-glucanase (GH16 family)
MQRNGSLRAARGARTRAFATLLVAIAATAIAFVPAGASAKHRDHAGPKAAALRRPPIRANWSLKLNDEFAGVDSNRWVPKFWWNGDTYWPTHELQAYRPANTTANGALTLTAKRDSGSLTNFRGSTTNSDGERFAYTSGLVTSGGIRGARQPGFQFTYGYLEARIWLPAGKGIFPAFWLLDSNYSDASEIDVMETIGSEPSTLQMHFHGSRGTYGSAYADPRGLAGAWHTYALNWQPGRLTWYLDGVQRATLARSDVPSNPHYVLLNLAVGGRNSWPGAPASATPFPAVMKVDWLRLWQQG